MEEFKVEESLGHLAAKVHQIFSAQFKKELAGYNITPPQFGTLAFLWRHDGISQIQLVNKMHKDRTTTSGIIDRLEKEGLVTRQGSPDDRRSHMVFVTDKGYRIRPALEGLALQVILDVTNMLTGEERETLRLLLKKVYDNAPHSLFL